MKITQETNEFKPITIVLETREEAQEFVEQLGKTTGRLTYEMYNFITKGTGIQDES